MKATKDFLIAFIFAGCQVADMDPWPDHTKSKLNDLILRSWQKTARKLGQQPGVRDPDVGSQPTPEEARKVDITLTLVLLPRVYY